jgi:hypothetical protein
VVTVEADAGSVERRLKAGRLACPGCAGVLTGWGYGRRRSVRGLDGPVQARPRRSRCTSCGVTHVLLPVMLLLRRADLAVVIGAALVAKARGGGYRSTAAMLGRPPETVRGWLRRFASRVEAIRTVFTGWLRALVADPVMPEPAASAWVDAVVAIVAAARAVADRFSLGMVAPWEVAVAVSAGCLLTPGWPSMSINTSSP